MKTKLFTVLFTALAIIMLTYVLSPEEKAAIGHEVTVTESEAVYILKDYKGKLAVFKENSEIPFEIFDVFTSNLPKKDREKVKEGIKATGTEELNTLVSDYTS